MNRAALLVTLSVTASLVGCGSGQRADQSLDTRDERYAQAADAAYLAFREGMPEQAARMYGAAMQRARLIDDRHAFVDAAYNRAYCYYLIGDLDAADRDLVEALASAAGNQVGSEIPTPALLLLRGEIARARGDLSGTQAMIERAMGASGVTRADRFRADVLRAHLAIDQRDLQSAKSIFAPLTRSGMADQLPYHALRARIAELAGDVDAAMDYDTEAAFAQGAARYRQMARALADAGRMYEKRPAWPLAADRYFAAARSYMSFGDHKTAADLARRAADAAAHTDDPDLKAAIADLLQTLAASP